MACRGSRVRNPLQTKIQFYQFEQEPNWSFFQRITLYHGTPTQWADRRTFKNFIFVKLYNQLIDPCITKKNLKFHQNRLTFVKVFLLTHLDWFDKTTCILTILFSKNLKKCGYFQGVELLEYGLAFFSLILAWEIKPKRWEPPTVPPLGYLVST